MDKFRLLRLVRKVWSNSSRFTALPHMSGLFEGEKQVLLKWYQFIEMVPWAIKLFLGEIRAKLL